MVAFPKSIGSIFQSVLSEHSLEREGRASGSAELAGFSYKF